MCTSSDITLLTLLAFENRRFLYTYHFTSGCVRRPLLFLVASYSQMILLYMIFILASVGVLVRGVDQDGGD